MSVGPPPVEADGDRNVTEIGVPNKYRARHFICGLWVTDKKENNHPATCLCDNGSQVNLQSERLLAEEHLDISPHPVPLEGVSGHVLPGGSTGSFLKAHMVAQDLWEEGKVEDVVLADYLYGAAIKYDLYLCHQEQIGPCRAQTLVYSGIRGDGGSELSFLALCVLKYKRLFE